MDTAPPVIRMTQVVKEQRHYQEGYSKSFLTEIDNYKLRLVVDVNGPYHQAHMAVWLSIVSVRYTLAKHDTK